MKSRETQADVASGDTAPAPAEAVDTGGRGQLPIAVSEGDFSTPTKRKRTITRPRGLKTLEQAPPAPVGAPEPSRVVDVPAVVLPVREASVVDEFLAAPPTPEPEVQLTPTPTPAPDTLTALSESEQPIEWSVDQPTDTVGDAMAMSQGPRTVEYHDEAAALPESVTTEPGSGVDLAMTFEATDPDRVVVDTLLEQATAQLLSSSDADVVVSDVVVFDETQRTSAVEAAPPPDPDGEKPPEAALSPLAQTLANMAEAMQGDLAEDTEIDIGDAPLLPLPAEALTTGRPRPPTGRTPPPLPSEVIGGQAAPVADERSAPPPLAGLPEALAERPRRPKRSKPWFEEVFDESYLRTLPFMTAEQTLREVDFIESSLGVPKGSEVLDVACGYGRHAIELVQRGLAVTGVDLSLPLLIRAADESQRRAVSVNFVHTDMREMSFDRQFAGAYCMLTSFGYFDEESNLRVAEGIARALKPGGRLLIDVINRDYIVGDLPARVWWEGDGCVVLEEVDFNFNTNRILTHRSVVFEDGQQLEQEISVRVYSLHELGKLLRQAGFRVIEVSGSIPTRGNFFGSNSRNLLILAERRAD